MASYLEQKFGLRGKVALVTGSSQGLGLAMARALAQSGADVIVNGRSAEKLAPVVKELQAFGVKATALAADLSVRADVEKLIAQAIAWQGHLDILVNNAGTIRRAPAVEHTDADWDAVLNVNLNGVFTACRAAGRYWLRGVPARSSTRPRCSHASAASPSPATPPARAPCGTSPRPSRTSGAGRRSR